MRERKRDKGAVVEGDQGRERESVVGRGGGDGREGV